MMVARGAHIKVRDAVWRVQDVNPTSTGHEAWSCVGVPRTAKKGDPTPAWTDVAHMTTEQGWTAHDKVHHTFEDAPLRGGPREKTVTYSGRRYPSEI